MVREAGDRRDALVSVARSARDGVGASVLGFASSGLPGPKGNLETFVWLAEAGRAGALDDDGIVAAAAAVEAVRRHEREDRDRADARPAGADRGGAGDAAPRGARRRVRRCASTARRSASTGCARRRGSSSTRR